MNIENITWKNIGQFQFCINLLPLELIWRSASCPRHWNQRWFGDAAFTIPSFAVVDCRRCWLHLCKVTTVLYHIFPNGRAIIGFNHGLPWCVKYMALGPPVATKPSGFAVGFCGDRRPSCHVFHTSRQAMIKTYIISFLIKLLIFHILLPYWDIKKNKPSSEPVLYSLLSKVYSLLIGLAFTQP